MSEYQKEYRYTIIMAGNYRMAEQKARELDLPMRAWIWLGDQNNRHLRGARSFRVVLGPLWVDNPSFVEVTNTIKAMAYGNDECDVSDLARAMDWRI